MIILAFLVILLTISCSPQSSISVVEVEHEEGGDFSPIVANILSENPDGNVELRFEEGRYDFYPEKATGKYFCVSNNDNGYKPVAVPIYDMKRVRIVGDNTEFIFHGGIVPFHIENSEDVVVRGISIDYDKSFVFEGEVIAQNEHDRSIDLKVSDHCDYSIRQGRAFLKGYDWEAEFGVNIIFDPVRKAPYYNTVKYTHNFRKKYFVAEELRKGVVRLKGWNGAELPPIGSIFANHGQPQSCRPYPTFSIQSSKNITLEDTNVYMTAAMALIAECTENVTMRNFNVMLRPNSGRYISATADATHFVNCRGEILYEDCRFENMLDDAANVHGIYMKVDEIISENRFAANFGHYGQYGFKFAKEGDMVGIIDSNTLLPLGKFKVVEAEEVSENRWIIELDGSLSDFVEGRKIAVENLTNCASVVMRRCTVRNNRARSLLISTPNPVLIEDCYFSSMMAGIIIAGDANKWCESGNTTDVVIRNNHFVNFGTGGGAPQSALHISPEIPAKYRDAGYYHRNILFENNIVESFDSQCIYGICVEELTIRNNKFVQTDDFEPLFNDLSCIDVQNCGCVTIEGNTYDGDDEAQASVINSRKINYTPSDGFFNEIVDRPNTFYYRQ